MQNKDNQRFYPLRDSENPFKVTLTPITEEQYRSLYPDIWSTQKREQYHRRCMCPKYYLWKCDGQCDLCEYHVPDIVSLDEPLPDGNGTLGDYIPDSSVTKWAFNANFERVCLSRYLSDLDISLETDSLGKKVVAELIKTAPPELQNVLELRQQLAKSSVKKYQPC